MVEILGDPHICQFDFTGLGDHQVCRLDIPVNDPVFRSISKAFGCFNDDMDRLLFRNGTTLENVGNGLPLNIFHHDVGEPGIRFQLHIHYGNNIRVLDLCRKLGFADKTFPELRIFLRRTAVQNLHGTQRIQLFVTDKIHRAHAA